MNGETLEPLENVSVSTAEIGKAVSTDENGAYWRMLMGGTYTLTFMKEG